MATFLDLPPELLQPIFQHLGSIDDVHYLMRTCTKTYEAMRRPRDYVNIMRSIISQSPQHLVTELRHNNNQIHATPLIPGYILNPWEKNFAAAITEGKFEYRSRPESYSDELVYEILARYQGLRVLEDLWLKRQLTATDFLAPDEAVDCDDLFHTYRNLIRRNELFEDRELQSRCRRTPETRYYNRLNADQRARFYAAVVKVWLLNEIRWFLTSFSYPSTFDLQIELLQMSKDYLKDQRHTPLLDELDSFAVFKFLYHHLLPLHGNALADQNSVKLPLTFSSNFTADYGHSAQLLQLFLHAGQTYLQPPDIIDLITRSEVSRKYPWPEVKLPTTTEIWHRPSRAYAFRVNVSLRHVHRRRYLRSTSLNHLNIIARSSFHQTRRNVSPVMPSPLDGQLYNLRDHANHHFLDSVLVEFERYERKQSQDGKKLADIRGVFESKWEDGLWSIWWWANGEDKARAKMERWRESESVGGLV
ncbi:hypothetical protein FB567DRAFT_460445 [Paraphoma chrysanthemicola]|uniref:F-box domain-containing protein n=1 Tax=Paraphoma chrysanthemicola TaxID=798071 RepID=A0A8K0RLQ8_9PLEO|nr:hypothetical protein FB567DRAFT_460445 [Paraphoma chrysanthemicola]